MEKIRNSVLDESLVYLLGGSKNESDINPTNHDFEFRRTSDGELVGELHFQHGALSEDGANGVTNEAVVASVIDRLKSFQRSKLACRENEFALQHLCEALFWLNEREARRKANKKFFDAK